MLSGADEHDKGAYLASLMSKVCIPSPKVLGRNLNIYTLKTSKLYIYRLEYHICPIKTMISHSIIYPTENNSTPIDFQFTPIVNEYHICSFILPPIVHQNF